MASKPTSVQSQSGSEIKKVAGNAIDPRVVCDSESKAKKVVDKQNLDVQSEMNSPPHCTCKHSEMSGVLECLIAAVKQKGKGKIKIEIEISKD